MYPRLSEFNTSLINSFDFDAEQVFELLSCGGPYITPETIEGFMEESVADITK